MGPKKIQAAPEYSVGVCGLDISATLAGFADTGPLLSPRALRPFMFVGKEPLRPPPEHMPSNMGAMGREVRTMSSA
jgi:hypothetical protein